ncbi:MAG: T9SS type A sorting domain-containing protein [Hymenobacter sp.]
MAVEALAAVVPAAGVAVPNPTAGPLTIWAGADVTQAEVLTLLGASVLKQQLAEPTPQVALDLSGLPAGVYLVRLATARGPQVVRVNKQ